MSNEIMLVFGEDGVAREYDDAWDITIHCESEEEQKAVLEKLNNSNQEAKNSNESSLTQKALDTISRQAAIDYCYQLINVEHQQGSDEMNYGQERVNQTETILHHLELMPSAQPNLQSTCNQLATDCISRKAAIDAFMTSTSDGDKADWCKWVLEQLPSAFVKDTNVPCKNTISRQAALDEIDGFLAADKYYHPYSQGKTIPVEEMRERLKQLPSAQPEPCEDAVSRDSVKFLLCKETCHPGAFCPDGFCREICEKVDALPSATQKQRMGEWIPVSERMPEKYGNYLISIHGEDEPDIGTINPNDKRGWSLCDANGFYWASDKELIVTAWMPLPEPYRAERRTDEKKNI